MAPKGTKTVTVTCGANTQEIENIVGRKVNEVRKSHAETFNIPEGADAMVAGKKAKESYRLKAGDKLEFVKQSGKKG